MKHLYNYVREIHSDLDFKFKAVRRHQRPIVNLQGSDGPILDQGQLGTCVENGTAGLYWRVLLQMMGQGKLPAGFAPSRAFLGYNTGIRIEHSDPREGAQICDALTALRKWGICPESEFPYLSNNFVTKPPDRCYTDAKIHIPTQSSRLASDLESLLSCLDAGFEFVAGIEVFPEFESDEVAATGIVPMPKPGQTTQDGHCIKFVGYNDTTERIRFANSWGYGWGQNGYGELPYGYITPQWFSDPQTIQAAT